MPHLETSPVQRCVFGLVSAVDVRPPLHHLPAELGLTVARGLRQNNHVKHDALDAVDKSAQETKCDNCMHRAANDLHINEKSAPKNAAHKTKRDQN